MEQEQEHAGRRRHGFNRRRFLEVTAGTAAGPLAVRVLPVDNAHAQGAASPRQARSRETLAVGLDVNGAMHQLAIDPRTTLLDALRLHLGLTGSKKGCDHGQCGACTVLVGGRRVLSCLTLAVMTRGPVTTIEGLAAPDGTLHPMQQAFIDEDAFQCGYCTPGQIMSAIACVHEGHASSPDEIREFMSGNLCRCAAYPHILAAIERAAPKMET